jgi:hypothetical protein
MPTPLPDSGTLSDLDPSQINAASAPSAVPLPDSGKLSDLDPSQIQTPEEYNEQTYGTPSQSLLGGTEQVAQGLIGPVAPAVEEMSGLTTGRDIQGRQEQLGAAAPALQAAGLIGGKFIPVLGEYTLGENLGRLGAGITQALPVASTVGRLAVSGVKNVAEFAALQGSDELTKMVTGDPDTSLGLAATRIGLSGLIGGAGGVVLGSVSPFFKKAGAVTGIDKILSDFMGEVPFLKQDLTPVEGMTKDITTRMQQTDELLGSGIKKDLISNLTQDVSPDQLAQHVRDVSESFDSAPSALKREPLFQEAVKNWQDAVTPTVDPMTRQPRFTPAADDVFSATEGAKRQFQEWGQYQKATVPASEVAWRNASQGMATDLRQSLEDPKVWNAAGDFQKSFNSALAPLYDIQKEFKPRFTTKEFGEGVADPTKVNTYWNTINKGTPSLRSNFLTNYLEGTDKVAQAVSDAHVNAGMLPPPEALFDSPAYLNHSLNTPITPGVKLARWGMIHGAQLLGNSTGELAAGATGAGLGSLVGHPLLGGYIGEKLLRPLFSALAKPFAETAIHSEAAKAAVDHVVNVSKGGTLFNDAIGNFFKSGARVISNELVPNQESRDRLQKALDTVQADPRTLLNTGGNIGHYLPGHATSAAQIATQGSQYLASIKPNPAPGNPLDAPAPISKHAQATYNRSLDIAQQPLLVLQHAKDGTLMPQDLQTLSAIYPALRQKLASQIGQELVAAKAKGVAIPYHQRIGLSMIAGLPVDSTLTPGYMQAVIASQINAAPQTQQPGPGSPRKPSAKALTEVSKGAQLYATDSQARGMEKRA